MINHSPTRLKSRPALATEPSRRIGRQDGTAGLHVTLVPDPIFISLAARKQAGSPQISELAKMWRGHFGTDLPTTPHHVAYKTGAAIWAGAHQWFIYVQNRADNPALLENMAASLGEAASLTDQSDGRVFLDVAGAAWRDALASLVPIDLHQRVFTPDSVALTHAHHIPTVIWGTATGGAMLAAPRAYAQSLFHAVTEAGARFGLEWRGV